MSGTSTPPTGTSGTATPLPAGITAPTPSSVSSNPRVTPPVSPTASSAPPPASAGGLASQPVTLPAITTGTSLVTVAPDHANPFRSVAMLMQAVTDSLEASSRTGGARRWVRIVRVRDYLQGDNKGIIAQGVDKGVTALIDGISYVQRFTLLAWDLLRQGDAVKAMFEASADFIDKVADPEFINSITAVVDGPQVSTSDNPLAILRTGTAEARKYVDKVPEPEDLDLIGQQLYRMLVVVQLPPEANDAGHAKLIGANQHVDMQLTGKLRLLQWGLGHPFNVREVVKGKDVGVTCLGARRVWRTPDLARQPQHARGEWRDASIPDSDEITYEFGFDTEALKSKDLDEARAILTTLGYAPGTDPGFTDELAHALEQFQVLNKLKQTGELDNPTINQLMHLAFNPDQPLQGGLRRAKPFSSAELQAANFRQLAA